MTAGDWHLSKPTITSSLLQICRTSDRRCEHQDHQAGSLFAGYGAFSPFSVSKSKGRDDGHLYDAKDLQEGLGWGAVDHRQRGLRGGVPAVAAAE
jgi:hypothetical protein